MPKVIKKKPARKKPAAEEDVKSAARDALDKIRARQKQVVLAAAGIAIIALFLVIALLYSSSSMNKARSLELEAFRYYSGEAGDESMSDEARWTKALELYQKSSEAKATPSALFYLGNCYYNLKDYDKALAQYNSFVDRFSGNMALLPLVYQKLASAYFKTDRDQEALNVLSSLERVDNGTFRDTALIIEARYYERSGNREAAQEKYRAIVSDFPLSPWIAEAGSKLPAKEEPAGTAEPEDTPEGAPADEAAADQETHAPPPAEPK
ncbi:MAG: tetratricopeptide repeat protein [Nitrospiraceae bacterium]|nr:MAG: tetratricopeptide repeat protein [Nitrospiraceae bacterium]